MILKGGAHALIRDLVGYVTKHMYLHAYIHVCVYVCKYVSICVCLSARVRMFVAKQFLWGWKLYHLLHCTQHKHKESEREEATVGKTVKTSSSIPFPREMTLCYHCAQFIARFAQLFVYTRVSDKK